MTALPAADPAVKRLSLIFRLLTLAAVIALGASFFQPAWWVALKAPNYPAHTFPDGVKIDFHVDRVANGCTLRESKEILEKEALDCVHEMDTINHFVGMFPIASGGPVEKMLSPFLFGFIGVLLVGFAIPGTKLRLGVMGIGFAVIAVWMGLALFKTDGVHYMGKGWLTGLVDSLGRSEDEGNLDQMHPVVRQLKESLAKSGIGDTAPKKVATSASKEDVIAVLKSVFEQKAPVSLTEAPPQWTGRGIDVMTWHYGESLNRWFNEPVKNGALLRIMTIVTYVVVGVVYAAMLVFLFIASRPRSPWFNLLPLVGVILPVAFLAEYAGWLWWYGHSLNAMGAFTLKPFMPTVFGDGKVAQFSTHSYPAIGFGLMCVVAALMAVALLIRRSLPDEAKD